MGFHSFSVLLVMKRILISVEKQYYLVREFNNCSILPYFYLPPSKTLIFPLFLDLLVRISCLSQVEEMSILIASGLCSVPQEGSSLASSFVVALTLCHLG